MFSLSFHDRFALKEDLFLSAENSKKIDNKTERVDSVQSRIHFAFIKSYKMAFSTSFSFELFALIEWVVSCGIIR